MSSASRLGRWFWGEHQAVRVRTLLVAALAVLLSNVFVVVWRAGDDPRGAQDAGGTVRPAVGDVELGGRVVRVDATVQIASPIETPFELEVPEAGAGGATLQDALVDGQRTSIVWGGGRPLAVSGPGGALLVGPGTTVSAVTEVTWHLDGPVHGLRPGTYRIDSPVAVGAGSLGRPVDAVEFEVDAQTTLQTNGNTRIRQPARPLALEGPGRLRVEGELAVRTSALDGVVATLSLAEGPFEVTLIPGAQNWSVDALLRGEVVTEPPLTSDENS